MVNESSFAIIEGYFSNLPARKRVVEVLLKHGLSVRNGKIYLGDKMEVPISSVAKAAHVNRRIVYMTIKYIEENTALRIFFEKVKPTLSLVELAPLMGWEVIEIEEISEEGQCTFSQVLEIIFRHNCKIRQVIGERFDFGLGHYYIVLEGTIPSEAIKQVEKIQGVVKITIITPEKDKKKLVCTYCEVKVCPRIHYSMK